jgi:isoquinoline 1-oxidoreductase subunit alpha
MALKLNINGMDHDVDADPTTPLLWVLRDHLAMTGTKYGCGVAKCGACTVHVDGQAIRSCSIPAAKVVGAKITTIEGLSANATHAVQLAWAEIDVPQCGYCQSGQMMAAAALLAARPKPSDRDIDEAMDNVCRCGTYLRIRAAVHRAAELM